MKLLQYITIVLFSLASVFFGCKSYGQTISTKDTTTRYWYYMWSLNTAHRSAWGENSMYLNHKPTKAEIIRELVRTLFDKKDKGVRFIQIDALQDFASESAYWKWKTGFDPIQEAYHKFQFAQYINLQ